MSPQLSVNLEVILVRKPSLKIERTMITLRNKQFPEIHELYINVDIFFSL